MKNKLLFTHKNCADGAGCVFTFINCGGNVDDVIYTDYKKTISEIVLTAAGLYNYSGIVIADVNVTEEDYLKIKSMYQGTVEIYDHHTGSIGWDVNDKDFKAASIDMCGCMLYWTNMLAELPTPELFKYIDDRDRWVHQYPESKYIGDAFFATNFDLEYFSMEEEGIASLLTMGKALAIQTKKQIDDLLRNTITVEILGIVTKMVNVPMHHSLIAEKLYTQFPDTITGVFWLNVSATGEMVYNFSVRSKSDTEIDVSALARSFGGGGHKHAAGFSVPASKLRYEGAKVIIS